MSFIPRQGFMALEQMKLDKEHDLLIKEWRKIAKKATYKKFDYDMLRSPTIDSSKNRLEYPAITFTNIFEGKLFEKLCSFYNVKTYRLRNECIIRVPDDENHRELGEALYIRVIHPQYLILCAEMMTSLERAADKYIELLNLLKLVPDL